MIRKLLLALSGVALCGVAVPPSSFAAETPTITIRKSDTIALGLNPIGGPDGALITKIVQNDLALSGYFSITDANRAAMTVGGADAGGSLQGKVLDVSGGTVLANSYRGGAREKAHAFANDIIETLTGNRGMAGSTIAFTATRSGRKEIYSANYDGSNVRQLTHDGSISVAPALSADGRRLAYTSYLKGYADIYSIDLASGARQRIVKFPGTNSGAAFSPDGSQIACTISRDGNPELYVVNANGSGARRITRTAGVESTPSWSPDGRELVYCSDDRGGPQIYRISASGGSGRLLTTGYRYCTKPTWSPDGKKVAFNIREGGVFRVAVLDLASNATRVLTSGGDARDPIWGPDSRHLLFTQGGNLLLLDAQNGRTVKILDGLGSISEPTWSR
jgi:TolB protein